MNHKTPAIARWGRYVTLALALCTLVPSSGCLHLLLASGIYLWQGGNIVPADCKALEEKRVVVLCRPPVSSEYRYANASRQMTKAVSALLAENVKKIDVVDPQEVDEWLDETDSEDYRDLGKAVEAELVVVIELDNFDLYKGTTLYQGDAHVTVNVYDMKEQGKLVWNRELGQVLYPANSPIPSQDKPVERFQAEFVNMLATKVAIHFYKHDPHADFAIDAMANR